MEPETPTAAMDVVDAAPQRRDTGTFSVALGSVEWRGNTAVSSIWTQTQVVIQSAPSERVWFPPSDENTRSRVVSLAGSAGSSAALEYEQTSRPVALTRVSLQEVAAATLTVNLFVGETRVAEKDALVGSAEIPLAAALLRGQLQQEVIITDVDGAALCSLDVAIHCDVDLADSMAGARLLQVHSPSILNLPSEWRIVGCESDEDAAHQCALSERNTAIYELTVYLPLLGGESDITDDNRETPIVLRGGKLVYEYVPTANEDIAQPAPSDQLELDATTTPVAVLTGLWVVRFPENCAEAVLYLTQSMQALEDFLAIEKRVRCVLTRVNSETSLSRVTDVVKTQFQLQLSDLLIAGSTRITTSAPLAALQPVERSAMEQEMSSLASPDDKKKLQALLSDFEVAIVQPTAVLSESVASAGTWLESTVEVLGAPIVPRPPAEVEAPAKSMEELITPRDVDDEHDQQRNSLDDLRREVRDVIAKLLREYEDTFRAPEEEEVARNDKRQTLIFRLNTQGAYHSFKETLKKRIISVTRERFATLETDETDQMASLSVDGEAGGTPREQKSSSPIDEKLKDRFGQIYAFIMDEVQQILRETFYANTCATERAHEASQGKPTRTEIAGVLATLRLKAMENEASRDLDKCEALHLDRVAFVETHLVSQNSAPALVEFGKAVWLDYAGFCMRHGQLNKAGANLKQCLRLDTRELPALVALAALQCEVGDFTQVEVLAKTCITEAASKVSSTTGSWEQLALAHALLGYYFAQSGRDSTGNLTLFETLKAQQVLQHHGGDRWQHQNAGRSSVWLFLAEYAHEHVLLRLTKNALQLADVSVKPREVLSSEQRVMKRVLEASLCLSDGDDGDRVVRTLQDALEIDASHPLAWLTLGKLYLQRDNSAGTAIECFQRAIEHRRRLRVEDRLALYVLLGLTQLHASQFAAAEKVFLTSCDEFHNASSWLGVGIACLRQEKWDGAQLALAMANRLDTTHPDVWGYQALHALTARSPVSSSDEQSAIYFVAQALRFNLSNPVLLRELSNGFVAIDRLEHAERLLRRSLACQDSSLTRKTLADVLAAQNCAEDALRQYAQSLSIAESVDERCDLLDKSAQLLVTLGRPEEAAEYRAMASEFRSEHG